MYSLSDRSTIVLWNENLQRISSIMGADDIDEPMDDTDDINVFNEGGGGDAAESSTDDNDEGNDDASAADGVVDGGEHSIITCTTSAGPLKMHFHKSWSPNGYERATSLFEKGYYDHSHFFRVVPHFLVQFGIGYTQDGELKRFSQSSIEDDPKRADLMPFRDGYVSFAGSGPNSRTSQLFIAYDRAQNLGTSPWETPFGEVVEGTQETVRKLYSGYGDMPPWGKGPEQGPIHSRGASYIEEDFPLLDKFETCSVERVASLTNLIKGSTSTDRKVVENKKESKSIQRHVRAATAKDEKNPASATAANQPEQPFLTLLLVLSFLVFVILLLGIRRRRMRKTGKSV
ncbi:hypothetical protein ACHAXS_002481 [Conticribra weissflogii]